MIKFVVFGLQRTGTTLVVTLLASHPRILSLGELFDDKEKIEGQVIPTYKLYLKQLSPAGDYTPAQHKGLIYRYLDNFFSKEDFKAVGFKLMLNQSQKYPVILDYLKENNIKLIYIFRENLLKTAISRLRAKETGIYNNMQPIFDSAGNAKTRLKIPVKSLFLALEYVARQNKDLENAITNCGLDYMTVFYEKLSQNRMAEAGKILKFLGIQEPVELNTKLQKVTPSELKDSVENYAEIRQALKDTPYACYLE